jgi:hypothetical protein
MIRTSPSIGQGRMHSPSLLQHAEYNTLTVLAFAPTSGMRVASCAIFLMVRLLAMRCGWTKSKQVVTVQWLCGLTVRMLLTS